MSDVAILLLAGACLATIASVVWAVCWLLVKALEIIWGGNKG